MRDQPIEEVDHLGPERLRLRLELRQRLREAVRSLHPPAPQRAQQLVVVVPRHRQRGAAPYHAHYESQHAGRVRASIDEVPEEDRPPALGRRDLERVRRRGIRHLANDVAQPLQQRPQLAVAAVHVPDQVERPRLVAAIVPRALSFDRHHLELLRRADHVDEAEPLLAQPLDRALELMVLSPDRRRRRGPVRASLVTGERLGEREIEDDRHGEHVVRPGKLDQRLPRLRLHVCRVDHRQQAAGQPLGGHVTQRVERVRRGRLVLAVVGHQHAELVGREHLRGFERRPGERRLPRPGDADQHHQAHLGHRQLHDRNTASCVGAPSASSASPTPRNSTA